MKKVTKRKGTMKAKATPRAKITAKACAKAGATPRTARANNKSIKISAALFKKLKGAAGETDINKFATQHLTNALG